MTLSELSEVLDVPLVCHFRTQPPIAGRESDRWYAELEGTETKEHKGDGILTSTTGNGPTPEHALRDLTQQLRGKLLVIDAYKKTRREFHVPRTLEAGAVGAGAWR